MIKTAAKEYTITRINKQNLGDLAKLHAAVYGVTPRKGYFEEKYDTGYTGAAYIGFIAYGPGQQPVAYYGVIPCFILYYEQVMLAAQSADTMTHPLHRYKGMFVELSNMTFDLCRKEAILLVFGFPNENSYHGAVNKLGWKMTTRMSCFIIPVNTIPLVRFANKVNFLKKIYRRYQRFILAHKLLPLKGIFNSVLADQFGGIDRSIDFLNYKSYNDTYVIKLKDVLIWLHTRNGFVIGDMQGINNGNFYAVIRSLKILARIAGVTQIQFHCSPGTKLHALFKKAYSEIPSYPILFQDFGSQIAPENIKFTFADIDIF